MAHAPEHPDLFACTACQTIHVGTVTAHTDSGHEYETPEECGACGATEFVGLENWPHHHE